MPRATYAQLPRFQQTQTAYDWLGLVNILCCALVVAALTVNQLIGPLTPLTVIAFVPICAILNRYRMGIAVASIAPLVLLPLLAVVSVVWSQAPGASLRYGILYLVSVIAGGFLGSLLRQEELLKGLVLGFTLVLLLNYALGRSMIDGTSGSLAFLGIQGSKNAFGEMSGITSIVCVAAVVHFLSRRAYLWGGVAFVGAGLGLAGLLLAKSTGALLASVIALFCLVCWLFSIRMSRALRNSIFIVTGMIVLVLIATFNFWFPPLFEFVLQETGKSVGLTGRDLLWREADEQIARRPVFGNGYNAFWVHGNLEAERLWRALGIKGRAGFNFHNTFREILVDLGVVGFVVFAIVGVTSALVLGARALIAPTVPLIMALSLLVYFIMKMPVESFGFGGMQIAGMLLYTCWAMGYASLWTARRR